MKICLLAIIAMLIVGCSTNLGTYTFASTSIIDSDVERDMNYIKGESCLFHILGIPLGDTSNRITLATMNALEEAHKKGYNAETLTDVTINNTAWTALLFGQNCIEVRGRPVINKAKLIEVQETRKMRQLNTR